MEMGLQPLVKHSLTFFHFRKMSFVWLFETNGVSTRKVIVLPQAEKLLSLSAACSKVIDGNNIYPYLPLIISLHECRAPPRR